MSFLRIFNCGKQLFNRKSLFTQCHVDFHSLKTQKHRLRDDKCWVARQKPLQGAEGLANPTNNFSTIARPHISKSLQKWKKRKRKSKAQQKRELESLRKDFTQLLTKRAVQLLREDSLHNRNRQVVTTHTFSSDSFIRLDNVTTQEASVIGHIKDELSERLEAHVQDLMYAETDSVYTKKGLPFSFQGVESPEEEKNRFPPIGIKPEENDELSSSDDIVQKYLNNLQTDASTSTPPLSNSSNVSFLTLSDIFSAVIRREKLSSAKLDDEISDSSIRLDKDKGQNAEASSSLQVGKDFSHLLSRFQAEMASSCGSKLRNWEYHDDQDHEKGKASSCPDPKPVSAADTSHTDNQMDIKVPGIDTKSLSLALPKDNAERRKGRKDQKDFQELIDKSFIDVCCFTGNELLAVRNIEFQSNRQGIASLDGINRLVHGLAKKQNLGAIKSLFTLLRQWNLPPTLQTYAGCLECVGRMKEPDSFLCERILVDIERNGYDVAEIANTCNFESDECDYVIKAIRLVDADFVPNRPPTPPGYTDELLVPLECENPKRLERNQYALDMSKAVMMERLGKQMEMEKAGLVEVPSIAVPGERSKEDEKIVKLRKEVSEYWRKSLCDSFTEKLETYEKKALNNMWMTVYPYLKLFSPDVYVNVIFKILQDLLSEAYSPTQVMCHLSLGHTLNRLYRIEAKVGAGMVDKMTRLYDQFAQGYLDQETVLDNHRKLWVDAMNSHSDTVNLDTSMKKWPRHVIKMIGKFLLDLILYDLKIDANLFKQRNQRRLVPAFCTIYRPDVTTFNVAEIKVHPVVSKLFKMEAMDTFQFEPNIVPMLVPPVPWVSQNMGGLLLGSYPLVRMGEDLYHHDPLKKVQDSQYTAVLDTLNTLSACAWKINTPILDLQIKIFQSNGDPALKLSPPASVLPPLPAMKSTMSSQEKAALYIERVQLQQQKRDMHGLWCSDLYRLSIANKFRDETFWFPHSMDFRGRTYPLPPHFNHLGSDNVRGMLLFAKGKPLGPKGHDWLKIHLINLTGFKKRSSNADRLAHADSIMDDILDSADQPLTGRKWWQTSDEPWQTLACCMELARIERWEGSKEDYVCHFPVHQDGSCNGLQHYAALGRDQAGSESVNLVPFNQPQDVYSDVVELVERERKRDAEDGHEIAIALDGLIKRKVIKQTIMTTVYGVTRFGAKAQIHKQLKDIPDLPQDLAWKASFYLTEKTFSSLREMFTATKDIQDWLTEAAQLISAFKPVDWVTPLGFPVSQPYFKRCTVANSRTKFTSKPNTVKQRNAFPPNYIHSLDSSHMMLTALYCMHRGITFVSVHDCFWTHACDVPIMNQVCREQFVSMHSQPLLEDLSQHLLQLVDRACLDPSLTDEMKNVNVTALKELLSDVPKRGTFDLNDVLKSTYFFS